MFDELMARVFHRQMYIDLIRAYLRDYGTQGALARALGVSDVAVHHWLKPLPPSDGQGTRAYWADADAAKQSPDIVRRELGLLQTPPSHRIVEIASRLCTDAERRKVLLHHIEAAKRSKGVPEQQYTELRRSDLEHVIGSIGDTHVITLTSYDPERTRIAYAVTWEAGAELLSSINAGDYPLERAQVLMFLHDAASVLNRPDLALAYARETTSMLRITSVPLDPQARDRMEVNALLAEAVTLNNLGLGADALDVASYALGLPSSETEVWNWKRSFLEQTLKGLGKSNRFSVCEAERLAAQARDYAGENADLLTGIDAYLAAAYVRYGSIPALRKAERIVEDTRTRVGIPGTSVPLRRVRLFRVAAALYGALHDREQQNEMLRQALDVIRIGGFTHQWAEVTRLYGRQIEVSHSDELQSLGHPHGVLS